MNIESARRSNSIWWLAGTTPLAIVLAHYLAVLPHEFMLQAIVEPASS